MKTVRLLLAFHVVAPPDATAGGKPTVDAGGAEAGEGARGESIRYERPRKGGHVPVHPQGRSHSFLLSKLGKSTIMQFYISNMDDYKPKGWLARVRASQTKTV